MKKIVYKGINPDGGSSESFKIEDIPEGWEVLEYEIEIEDENIEITNNYIQRLQYYSTDLRIRAKAAAIGKKGERDYIFAQVEMYELKYRLAMGLINDSYMLQLLSEEAVEFGLSIGVEMSLQQFQELIIYMYESAESQYQVFLFMIERCRTFIQTLIENANWTKVDQAFALIDTLNDQAQAPELMANILNL
ncbi:hypothetical protein ACI6PS_02465 [Flavobacterium sp. PLA-1-15]|uniref:hypothetical protein n=1 Tax=Flavobacterium sp. PLA-1-15 TaxID=3380533 RepID=UPI003B794340